MSNRKMIVLIVLLIPLLVLGCGAAQEVDRYELSEEEIQEILAQVTGGEEALKQAGLQYFSQLSSENRNLLDARTLDQLISTNSDDLYILDIRNKEDFDAGHIQGANNTWWFDVGEKLEELPVDKRIVVVCYSGQSAGQVVGVLRVLGFDAVALTGGMNNGWNATFGQ